MKDIPTDPLLKVKNLEVCFPSGQGMIHAVDNISFSLEKGRVLGIVGESGCGKTMVCKAIMGLLPKEARISENSQIIFNGCSLTCNPGKAFNPIRGKEMAMVFQNPMTALNPVMTIGRQIAEPLVHHLRMPYKDALDQALDLMASVGIPNPGMRIRQYPHQLSGGLQQRVVIAAALACRPKLLIADEPTTALDVTVQAGILDLLDQLCTHHHMAMILITHDLSVAAARCRDIAVMHMGKIVEKAPTKTLFSHMKMPYTKALFDALPRLDTKVPEPPDPINGTPPCLMAKSIPVLEVQHLGVSYALGRNKTLSAVNDVSFQIRKGKTLGLVGESGCGKSSVAMAIMQLPPPRSGRIMLRGKEVTRLDKQQLRQLRPKFQIVFQDSVSALNPRRTIGHAVAMPLHVMGKTRPDRIRKQVCEMLDLVGIDPKFYNRRPHELSGGQCQRVQIARALITGPDLLVLDEPVSSLDVSVQARILELLENLKKRCDLTMLFISHDLAVVRQICDNVAVMHQGRICEISPCKTIYKAPSHPYTQALLSAVPTPEAFFN